MSEVAIYTMVMFWLGVFLTKIIFYFEQRSEKRRVHNSLFVSLAYTLSCAEAIIRANSIIFLEDYGDKDLDYQSEDFIKKQEKEINMTMCILTSLALSSVEPKIRARAPFMDWEELKALLKKQEKEKN